MKEKLSEKLPSEKQNKTNSQAERVEKSSSVAPQAVDVVQWGGEIIMMAVSVKSSSAPVSELRMRRQRYRPQRRRRHVAEVSVAAQAPVIRRICWRRQLRVEGRAITRQVRRITGIQRGARAGDVGGEVGFAIVMR